MGEPCTSTTTTKKYFKTKIPSKKAGSKYSYARVSVLHGNRKKYGPS